MSDYWVTIGLAALVGVVVGALVNTWSVLRNIKHKSVIEERQKWREALRDLIPRLVAADDPGKREQMRNSVVLRLNPYRDRTAMRLLDQHLENGTRDSGLQVVEHFQTLLKHDWERAKIEAGIFPFFASRRADSRVRRQSGLRRASDAPVSSTRGAIDRAP